MVKAVETRGLEVFALWKGLPDELLTRVAARVIVLSATAGQMLISKGDPPKGVFFVVSGQLKVWDEEDGVEVILGLVEPGGMFGERSVIDDGPHNAHVSVLRNSVLLRLMPEAATHFFFNEPQVARRLMQRLSALVDEANFHRRVMSNRNAALRLWRVLVSLSREEGGQRVIDQLPTQEELARISGLARETVSRLLSSWRDEGRADKKGRRLNLRVEEKG